MERNKLYVQDNEEKPEIKEPPTSDVTDMPESEPVVEEVDDDADDNAVDEDEEENA